MANRGRKSDAGNNTGLPSNLKSGIENLSAHSMGSVNVHHNNPRPAQVQANATAQGNNIHLPSGQARHLPHEATHVVQQRQGRVQPTTHVGGMPVNQGRSLERSADKMASRATNGAIKK